MPRIGVLIDNNTLDDHLAREHGLSLVILLDSGDRWLWDTGQSGIFFDNARAMGIDLAQLSGLALSHGHYDHAGGLDRLWRETDFTGPIYGHPAVMTGRYACSCCSPPRAIGLRTVNRQRLASQLIPVSDTARLGPGLTMVTNITRKAGNFEPIQGFYLDPLGRTTDTIPDDTALVLETGYGPVLILGCCHSGLENTCDHIAVNLGINRFHALIGGLHLKSAKPNHIEETLQTITRFGFSEVYAGHCTGTHAISSLSDALPGKIHPMGSGLLLTFPPSGHSTT